MRTSSLRTCLCAPAASLCWQTWEPPQNSPRSPALVVIDDNLESEGALGLSTVLTIAIPVVAVLLLGGAAIAFFVCRNHAKRRASRGSGPQFSAGPMILTHHASDMIEIDLALAAEAVPSVL